MRLWSIHPKYLDSKGLVALWREALHAKKVLENKTKGYRHHPQLIRFKKQENRLRYINSFLLNIWKESCRRGYCFNKRKIGKDKTENKIKINHAQLNYELNLLKIKLKTRDKKAYEKIKDISKPVPNPLFSIKKGQIEHWEKIV